MAKPILAIPGNHDGDVSDNGKRVNPEASPDTFVRNFRAGRPSGREADAARPVIVALHHPPFSLDTITAAAARRQNN